MPRQAAAALAGAAQKIASIDHRRSMRLATIAAEAAWFAGHRERLGQLDTFVSGLPASQGMPGGFMRAYIEALAATLRGGLPGAASQLRAAAGRAAGLSEQRPLTWAGDCALLLQDSAAAQEFYSRAVDRSRELANIADLMHALHLRARCELDLGKVAVAEADAAEALQFGRQLSSRESSPTVWPSWRGWPPSAATSLNPAAAPRMPWNTPYPTAFILPSAPLSWRTPKSTSASATPAPRWSGSNH